MGGLACCPANTAKHIGQSQAAGHGPAVSGAVRCEGTEPRRCPRPALPGVCAEARPPVARRTRTREIDPVPALFKDKLLPLAGHEKGALFAIGVV
jgi:hypothetical protein